MRYIVSVKISEILRLSELGFSQRIIAKSVKCGKSTVGDIQLLAKKIDLSYEQSATMTNADVRDLLYPQIVNRNNAKAEPDFQDIYQQLSDGSRKNLQYFWEEYRVINRTGLAYSQFCERYNKWLIKAGKNVTMHQERLPGKELFVDWMGDKPRLIIDSQTGELREVHIFVCTLGNSGMPYVEAFSDEKIFNWLQAHVNAFEYYGGLPLILVPDNCKTAVTNPTYYDPAINPAYWELATYHEVAVIPARIKEPQDKAPVESSIGWLETWLVGWLEKQQYFSFPELNMAIQRRLDELVRRPFQKRPGCRLTAFAEIDRPHLRPLKHHKFKPAMMVFRIVPDNYHVEFGGFYFSVPFTTYKQRITLRIMPDKIEFYDENRRFLTVHERNSSGPRYITNPDHMPERHKKYHESKQFDGARYRSWAANIGENTFFVIDSLLNSYKIEQQAYKSCMGILHMTKKHGEDRLEAACLKARSLNSCIYTTINSILKNGQDKLETAINNQVIPKHDNIRGDYV